ncbi:MAG: TIGR01459 family HAD-type hydrolase [Acidisphaera sp.]|nr:TIGR01459 family HAD-type hydrolase [Acidisphaera sp.]
MQHLTGFAPLAQRYQGFVVDLWGVIHDGVTPYAGAVDCLERLARAGKPVVLLSNAPRRAGVAREGMRAMGIADRLYTDLLTSGEVTHRLLRDRGDPWFASLGRRVFHLGPARDRNVMHGLDLEPVAEPGAASFVLNTGPDDHRSPTDIAEYEPVLRDCARHRLPMVCANPDLEVIRGGKRVICAGALAQRYLTMGGAVRSIGKPDPAVYVPVLAALGLPTARVLAVGDALRTDIAGAAAAGIDACWVLGGIHAGFSGDPAEAERAAASAGLSPVATVPAFVW